MYSMHIKPTYSSLSLSLSFSLLSLLIHPPCCFITVFRTFSELNDPVELMKMCEKLCHSLAAEIQEEGLKVIDVK